MVTKAAKTDRILEITIAVIAILGVLYHLVSTQYLFQTVIDHQTNHFLMALLIVFLVTLKKFPKRWPIIGIFILLGVAACLYVKIFLPDLEMRAGMPNTVDVIIGIMLIVVAMEASRQAFGLVIPLLALIFILYVFLGQYMPGPLYHAKFDFGYIISSLSIGLSGMYGTALAVSVNYIFLFFVFGGILESSGAIEFFEQLGKIVGQRLRGGPAQTAVLSSALVGMVTGSSAANVSIVGPFTIPLMKKVGYSAEQAGAIEASASTGSQIMPPVMGAAAFLMAGISGVSYVNIMLAAIIPAALFFLGIGVYAELQARAANLPRAKKEDIDYKKMLVRLPCFGVPLGALMVLLLRGNSPMFSAFWAIILMVVTSIATDYILKQRPNISKLTKGVINGAIGGSQIAVTSACLGFILVAVTMTGLGTKLPGLVSTLSGGNVIIALFITMVASIILGMGVPTLVAYLLVAIMVVPSLMNMGVPLFPAHFFCFFFAIFSGVTPPVALNAIVASKIAQSSYLKTAWMASKISIICIILPWMCVFNPSIMMIFPDFFTGFFSIVGAFLSLVGIGVLMTGCFINLVNLFFRILFGVTTLLFLAFVFSLNYTFLIAGVVLLALLAIYQIRENSKLKKTGLSGATG